MEPPTKRLRRSVSELPPEIWVHILSFLEITPMQLAILQQVSRTFASLAGEPAVPLTERLLSEFAKSTADKERVTRLLRQLAVVLHKPSLYSSTAAVAPIRAYHRQLVEWWELGDGFLRIVLTLWEELTGEAWETTLKQSRLMIKVPKPVGLPVGILFTKFPSIRSAEPTDAEVLTFLDGAREGTIRGVLTLWLHPTAGGCARRWFIELRRFVYQLEFLLKLDMETGRAARF